MGANADTINDTGDVTDRDSFVSRSSHTVFIDIESLPTGIEMPSSGQISKPTVSTVAYS